MSRPASQKEETQRQIVATAIRIIKARGSKALSMRTLARELKRSPASLYKYFPNKAAILEAVREEVLKEMAAQFYEAEIEHAWPLEKVCTACRAMISYAEKEPQLYWLIYQRLNNARPDIKAIFNTFQFQYMQKQLRIAHRHGLLNLPNGFTVELLLLQLWACIHGVIMLRQTLMETEDVFTDVSDQMLEQMLENLENPKELWKVPYPAFKP